jgi:hypothetical protein
MNGWMKNVLWLLSALPLLSKAHYVYRTWIDSPLERGGWIIWVCIPAALFLCEYIRRKVRNHSGKHKGEYRGLFIAAIVIVAAAWVYFSFGASRVHAISILLGIAFFYLATGLRWGLSVFISQWPCVFFAILATPSLSFWVGHYMDFELKNALSYVVAKLALVVLPGRVEPLGLLQEGFPRLQSFIFSLALCAVALVALAQRQLVQNGAPIQLNLQELQSGEWLARKVEVTQRDLNFFTGCTWIGRMEYFDNQSALSLLALEVADITNLHPMPICLKSGGAEILSSSQIYLHVHGKPVQVNELEILTGGTRSMAYSVYSNDEFSTGNFARFRLLRKDRKIWWHYQIITPVEPDKETAHRRVESFLNTFAVELKTPAEESPLEK